MLKLQKHPALNQFVQLLGLSLGALATTHAQTIQSEAAVSLKEVVISGSRSEQYIDDLPLSIDVIGSKDIEEGQIGDIRDIAKNLPNVSVKRAPARFSVTGRGNPAGADGNAGFSIRGQGGNRVVMLVDGVRLPRSYINGSNAFGRDSVSVGLLKRIELVRGPTSVLYGSDGLAGLVNFITLEPADFLLQTNGDPKTAGGKAWLSYSGDDKGVAVGGTVARRAGNNAEWSVTVTKDRANGLNNMGTNDAANVDRTTPNPQTNRGDSLLGKLVLRPSAGQRHVLSLEHVTKDADVELLSSRAKPPYTGTAAQRAAAIVDETSSKSMDRNRLTWDARYQLNTSLADNLQTVLSWQDGAAQDNGQTVRNDSGVRIRKTSYNERTLQGNVQADKTVRMSPQWSHKLTYGLDYVQTEISSFADGSDPVPLPAFSPRKYFPDTRDTSRAIYIQSEMISNDWSITPGLRLDQFSLEVINQAGYYPGLATAPGKSISGSAVSPKLGALYRATPQWSIYGNYASGFRAPEGQQVNSALEVSTAKLLPNPDLKPEESRNFEIGMRTRMDRLSLDIAIFTGHYTNLIVEKKDLGTANGLTATSTNPTLFQTINIDKATIKGFEIKGNMAWGQVAGGRLSSPFGYGQTRGTNDTTGLPLSYIEPAKLAAGLKYETPLWDLRMDVNHHVEKNASELESPYIPRSTSQLQFTTPSATTFDLSGQWRIRKDVRLNFAIINLTDQKYWNWSDVQGLASNASPVVVDAYTQPGRHFNVSLVADF
ncbi:MAG: TonB-dependent hemoglobin/transferrin/lactoferrin family receptor [Rhodoferax sp.]|nr:TonB-dependent hemoglobin/transferrin/lactoferrin family receptor [Rhodoferax sp.]